MSIIFSYVLFLFKLEGWILSHNSIAAFYSENLAIVETKSRDSPLSIMSSQSNRRCDGAAFVPICLPPSYQPPNGQTRQQVVPSPLLPTAVQIVILNKIFKFSNNWYRNRWVIEERSTKCINQMSVSLGCPWKSFGHISFHTNIILIIIK